MKSRSELAHSIAFLFAGPKHVAMFRDHATLTIFGRDIPKSDAHVGTSIHRIVLRRDDAHLWLCCSFSVAYRRPSRSWAPRALSTSISRTLEGWATSGSFRAISRSARCACRLRCGSRSCLVLVLVAHVRFSLQFRWYADPRLPRLLVSCKCIALASVVLSASKPPACRFADVVGNWVSQWANDIAVRSHALMFVR